MACLGWGGIEIGEEGKNHVIEEQRRKIIAPEVEKGFGEWKRRKC